MLTTLLAFAGIGLLFAMIPGPDFALIVRISLIKGRMAAVYSSLGIACGLTVHTALSVAGLSAVIAHSPFLFKCITYLGAAYLAYIGLCSLFARAPKEKDRQAHPQPEGNAPAASGRRTAGSAFLQGFLCNVLNPKAVIFFLTFLPQFVDAGHAVPVQAQLLILGILMVLVTGAWFVCLSLLLAHLKRFFENETFRRRLERVTGVIFLGFSARLLASQ
ncbi:MAG: LysE family translocator [Desulfovibrionaceae bacterium]|nr:LysE family translocator [Desulfovibrionaceae bacterium]